jgi:CHASE3 domain sensor protein
MNKPIELTQQQKDNIEKIWFLAPEQKKRLADAIRNHSYQMDDKINRKLDVYVHMMKKNDQFYKDSIITQELRIAVAGVFHAIPMLIADVISWSSKEERAYIDGKTKTLD